MKIGDILEIKLKVEKEVDGCEGCYFNYRGGCYANYSYDCDSEDRECIFVETKEEL